MSKKHATNFQRTKSWLQSCGKKPSFTNSSVQIGCHIEEFIEFLNSLTWLGKMPEARAREAIFALNQISSMFKSGEAVGFIHHNDEEKALDAICDMEVTGNGLCFLLGFDKEGADKEVLDANDRKLVDGKPVLLPGGKIGKPEGWVGPSIRKFTQIGQLAQDSSSEDL
jgi:predicted HAD superfamily Cof-like phosphohydrolase